MNPNMILIDPDEAYGEKLTEALNTCGTFPYRVRFRKDADEAKKLMKTEEFSAAVVSEQLLETVFSDGSYGGVVKICLSETAGRKNGPTPTVCKYLPFERIKAEFLEALQDAVPAANGRAGQGGVTFIGVQSPVGRSMKTGFCFAAGQLYAARQKTLFVSLEYCSGLSNALRTGDSLDLSELLYRETSGFSDGRDAFLYRFHELDVLSGPKVPEDVFGTDGSVVRDSVRSFALKMSYRTVILDLGSAYHVTEAFLPELAALYVPVKDDDLSEARVNEYLSWIERIDPGAAAKVKTIRIPVPNKPFSSMKPYLENLLFSETGEFIRKTIGLSR